MVGSKMGIEWECKWHILANFNFPWRCHWIKFHKRFTKFHLFRKTWKSSDSIELALEPNFSIQATLQVVAVKAITSLIEMSAAIVLFVFGPQLLPASKRLAWKDLKIQPQKMTQSFESQKDNRHRQNKTCSHPTKKTITRFCPGSSSNHQNTKTSHQKKTHLFYTSWLFCLMFSPSRCPVVTSKLLPPCSSQV